MAAQHYPEFRQRASIQACAQLAAREEWRGARAVLVYAPRQDELDITELVDNAQMTGKIVALPQYDAGGGCYRACQLEGPLAELSAGRYGIPEPRVGCARIPMDQLDLALVPGVAFDLLGHRLGRGRGYYDRLLAALGACKCGVSFDEQVQAHIPVEPHDVVLNCILTPTRWVDLRPRRHGNDVVG